MNKDSSRAARRPLVSVVIPYYQRSRGVLASCVTAILAQQGDFELKVIIADDGSPVPAEGDLIAAGCLDPRVRIIRQENAGAGAARNKALEHVDPMTDYIALMDSDDQWTPGYLTDAVFALEGGYDLFFSDTRRFSQRESRFNWEQDPALNLNPEDHLLFDKRKALYEYRGDFFDFTVRRSSILSSSAMTYRRSVAPDLRFNEKLRNGQDRLFKLHLCRRVGKVAFSPKVLCMEGEGVNIFDSSSWGSPKALLLSSSYIDLAKTILAELPLKAEQRRYVAGQLGAARREFVAGLLHLALRRERFDGQLVVTTLRKDPRTLLALLEILGRAVRLRLGGVSS